MDERLIELLSRHLDGDLTDAERAEFERALENDPALRVELDNERQLRRAVREIADRMEPPAELDSVMEPLRRAAPPPGRRVRPVYRWLGAAAAVVLGVTVTLEMVRRNPPTLAVKQARTSSAPSEDREIFELAPLPSAVPGDNRPIGATDRLLEEDPPAPAAPEPEALEVVGPLQNGEAPVASAGAPKGREKRAAVARADDETGLGAPATTGHAAGLGERESTTPGRRVPRSQTSETGGEEGGERGAAARIADEDRMESAAPARQAPTSTARVVVDGVEVWSGSSDDCAAGRWPVVLVVRGGRIVELRPATGEGTVPTSPICLPDGLVNAKMKDLPDGEVTAEVEIRSTQ